MIPSDNNAQNSKLQTQTSFNKRKTRAERIAEKNAKKLEESKLQDSDYFFDNQNENSSKHPTSESNEFLDVKK